jgi:UDP-N-acetylglucosamine 2-epimerase (non-hydrolysing)
MRKILCVFGTRPEAIKFAPLVKLAKTEFADKLDVQVAVTAQHRSMLDQVLDVFGIKPDYDLDIMRANQDLYDISVNALSGLKTVLDQSEPDCILVQGDTTTTFIGALAGFYRKTKIGHIEAGLRTHNKFNPFPEEVNRRLTTVVSDYHFAPTEQSRDNLLAERVPANDVVITGNTSIDALLWVLENTQDELHKVLDVNKVFQPGKKTVLLTTHRRESFGAPMENSLSAVRDLAEARDDISIIMPVHFNPNVREKVDAILDGCPNLTLIDPLDYLNFAHLMNRVDLILTDSGGIQEEAPTLGKPILVMRDNTERPEGVEAGTAKLVGTNRELIFNEAMRLLSDEQAYAEMAEATNPYGDGSASRQILQLLAERLD